MASVRFIAGPEIMRASLAAVAIINLFNLMFSALFPLYAVRELHISLGLIGVVLGAAAVGGILGFLVLLPSPVRGCTMPSAES